MQDRWDLQEFSYNLRHHDQQLYGGVKSKTNLYNIVKVAFYLYSTIVIHTAIYNVQITPKKQKDKIGAINCEAKGAWMYIKNVF